MLFSFEFNKSIKEDKTPIEHDAKVNNMFSNLHKNTLFSRKTHFQKYFFLKNAYYLN